MKKIFFLTAVVFLAGCTSLRTVSLTSIPPKRDRPVRAEASRFIFLGFNFDNDYVDQMTNDLKNQCQDGVISGILTKDETVDYFLMIFWSHRVTATGYCSKPGAGKAGMQSSKPRRPSDERSSQPEAEPEVSTPGWIE